MITLSKIKDLRAAVKQQKQQGKRIALVPTMGNLHEGHIALVEEAGSVADYVITSIFVNPLQFGANEDLDSYPRTLTEDQAKLVNAGCHLLFTPSVEQLYPLGLETHSKVCVPQITARLCGAARPGHFDGVTTIVSILFNLSQPDVALFGQKDYQQVAVIRKMAKDLYFPIEIIACPTVREKSGLARSSRNGYLSPAEKKQASQLYQCLKNLQKCIQDGERNYARLVQQQNETLEANGFVVDYLEVVNSETLEPATKTDSQITLLVAAFLGETRLIDNISMTL